MSETETARLPYIFQWTSANFRLVGPFATGEDSLIWARGYDEEHTDPRWAQMLLRPEKIRDLPSVSEPPRSVVRHTRSDLGTNEIGIYIMRWTNRSFYVTGPFATFKMARDYGTSTQEDLGDDPNWKLMICVESVLTDPMEVVDPKTFPKEVNDEHYRYQAFPKIAEVRFPE